MSFLRKISSILFAICSLALASILFILSVSFPFVSKSDVNIFYKLLILFLVSTAIKNIILVLYFIKKQKLPHCTKKIISIDFIFSGVCILLVVFYLVVGIANGLQTFIDIMLNIATLFVGIVLVNGYYMIWQILINQMKRKTNSNIAHNNWSRLFDRRMVWLIIVYTLNLFFIFLLQLFTFVFMITHEQPKDLIYLIIVTCLNVALLIICTMLDLIAKKDVLSILLVDFLCIVPYGTFVVLTANNSIPTILMFYVFSLSGAIAAFLISNIREKQKRIQNSNC